MKSNFILKALGFIILFMCWIQSALALGIDHFNVTMEPGNVKVGEAVDLTIEAVDKNDNVVTDYEGSILVFSETDEEADFPTVLRDSSYTFEASDQWSVTFENAVVFTEAGTQSLSIYDLDDDTIWWEASVEVTAKQVISDTEITIVSPDDRVTVAGSDLVVSGQTKKNHSVIVKIDDASTQETTSNSDGIFEVSFSDLSNGEHTILAEILNADKDVIGQSTPTTINVDASLPVFKNFDIKPGKTDLAPESQVELIVLASKGLTKVAIILNDTIELLEEVSDGLYTKVTNVPEEPGDYQIDIVLEDELSHEVKIQWADVLSIKALEAAPIVVTWSTLPVVELEPEVEPEPTPRDPLTITNLKLVELKTKSVLSWDSVETAENYNVYKVATDEAGEMTGKLELIDTVTEPMIEVAIVWDEIKYDYFAVKAQAKTGSGEELYQWDLSEAAKVKTGPEILILLLISLLVGGVFVFTRKQA